MEIFNKYNGLFLTLAPIVWFLCFISVFSEQDYFFYLSPLPICIFYIAIGYHFFGKDNYVEDMSFNFKNLRTTWPWFYYLFVFQLYLWSITIAIVMPMSVKKGIQELAYKSEWETIIINELIDNQNLTTAFGESRKYTKPEWKTDSVSLDKHSKIYTSGELKYGTFNLSIDQNGQLLKIDSIIIE